MRKKFYKLTSTNNKEIAMLEDLFLAALAEALENIFEE